MCVLFSVCMRECLKVPLEQSSSTWVCSRPRAFRHPQAVSPHELTMLPRVHGDLFDVETPLFSKIISPKHNQTHVGVHCYNLDVHIMFKTPVRLSQNASQRRLSTELFGSSQWTGLVEHMKPSLISPTMRRFHPNSCNPSI